MNGLHEQLTAIQGVARAQVEISETGPPAVRLHLEPEADRRLVGESVQQVLAAHGLRSRVAPSRREAEPQTPPSPPADRQRRVMAALHPQGDSGRPAPGQSSSEHRRDRVPAGDEQPIGTTARLAGVSVSENRSGVTIAVHDEGGSSATRVARRGEGGVRDAVVAAVSELVRPGAPVPAVLILRTSELAERRVVTLVLDFGGGRVNVGSAFVEVGWELALARAAWSALVD